MNETINASIPFGVYDSLKDKLVAAEKQVALLERANAVLDADKNRLMSEEGKDNKVLTIQDYSWGGRNVSYKNLDDVKELIATELQIDEQRFKKQLNDKQSEIDGLEQEVKLTRVNTSRKLELANADFSDKKIRMADDFKREFAKKEEDLNKQLSDLQIELQKVKDNKTDAELAEARAKEIELLNKRIATLEVEVDNLSKMNGIQRFWYRVTNRAALKTYVEDKEKINEELRKVSGMHRWMKYFQGYISR